MKDLEQSLLELHQIFLDMAVLVEAQVEYPCRCRHNTRLLSMGVHTAYLTLLAFAHALHICIVCLR